MPEPLNVRDAAGRALGRSPGGPEDAARALAEDGEGRRIWTAGRAGRRIAALGTILDAILAPTNDGHRSALTARRPQREPARIAAVRVNLPLHGRRHAELAEPEDLERVRAELVQRVGTCIGKCSAADVRAR